MLAELLGKAAHDYSKTTEAKQLYLEMSKSQEPDQGPCFVIASALQRIGGGVLCGFEQHSFYGHILVHVCLKLDGMYIDGRGALELIPALNAYIKRYGNGYRGKIVRLPDWARRTTTGWHYGETYIDAIEDGIRRQLGGGTPVRSRGRGILLELRGSKALQEVDLKTRSG